MLVTRLIPLQAPWYIIKLNQIKKIRSPGPDMVTGRRLVLGSCRYPSADRFKDRQLFFAYEGSRVRRPWGLYFRSTNHQEAADASCRNSIRLQVAGATCVIVNLFQSGGSSDAERKEIRIECCLSHFFYQLRGYSTTWIPCSPAGSNLSGNNSSSRPNIPEWLTFWNGLILRPLFSIV
jgi:hypothetical protein